MVSTNRKKRVAQAVAITLPIFIALLALFQSTTKKRETLTINNRKIKVEVAATSAERYQGLSGRSTLCADCGLLFKFPASMDLDFVMRGMKFPLDMIFINNGQIIKIADNLPPADSEPAKIYSSDGLANEVLEVNAGWAAQSGARVGDAVIESN